MYRSTLRTSIYEGSTGHIKKRSKDGIDYVVFADYGTDIK